MASRVTNRGIVYWTDREDKILLNHINEPLEKLRNLLPSRTDSAIYQRQWKMRKNPDKILSEDTHVHRVYPVTDNRLADTITFELHGISITINFQK